MKTLIAIDPGHGMNTAGKQTPQFKDGTIMKEREFNKAVAGYLKPLLEGSGFDVLNVAESDIDVSLSTRAATANNSPIKNKFNRPADFYISIHANAHGDAKSFNDANGIETFIYNTIVSGSKTETWAKTIQNRLISATGLRDRGLKREGFDVLRLTAMPAALVECGFMTNLEEAGLLRSDTYRRTVAGALFKAISDIFNVTPVTANETPVNAVTPPVNSANEPSAWAKTAWEWGKANKITDGTTPQGAPTREQVVQLIYNYHHSGLKG